MFDYVIKYNEFAKNLATLKDKRSILASCFKEVFKNTKWLENINKFNENGIEYIDPFTFLCIINGYSPANRIKLINKVSDFCGFEPISFLDNENFEGVSVLDRNHKILLNYRVGKNQLIESSNLLWDLFGLAVKESLTSEEKNTVASLFDELQNKASRSWDRLAHGFSYANPSKYIALSSPNRNILCIESYVGKEISEFSRSISLMRITGSNYLKLNDKLAKSEQTIPFISHQGYLIDKEIKNGFQDFKNNKHIYEEIENKQIKNFDHEIETNFNLKLYEKVKNTKQYKQRSERIRKEALSHSGYDCFCDCKKQYFTSRTTKQHFLETHHLIPMCYQKDSRFQTINLDCVENIVCLCPHCHRKLHLGTYKECKNDLDTLFTKNENNFKKMKIHMTLRQFINLYFKKKE